METLKIEKTGTINREHGLRLLEQMLLMRRFEEKAAQLYTQEKIRGFLHLYIGEEAVATGVMQALTKDDSVVSTYREHGHALARGMDPGILMAELFGKQQGCSRGRGGSMHLFDRNANFFGGNSIVGGQLPLALGMALASKKQKKNNLICCFMGDGAVAEGEFHEVMNMAALWQLPLLLVCENNLYAMGTAIRFAHSMTELEKKAGGYGMDSAAVDGMDVLAVEKAAGVAAGIVRTSQKPYFLVCNTYRFRAHSMFDPEIYRDKSEVDEWKKRDPITQLKQMMLEEQILTVDDYASLETQVEASVQQAVEFAEKGTWEPVEQLEQFVYSPQQKK